MIDQIPVCGDLAGYGDGLRVEEGDLLSEELPDELDAKVLDCSDGGYVKDYLRDFSIDEPADQTKQNERVTGQSTYRPSVSQREPSYEDVHK